MAGRIHSKPRRKTIADKVHRRTAMTLPVGAASVRPPDSKVEGREISPAIAMDRAARRSPRHAMTARRRAHRSASRPPRGRPPRATIIAVGGSASAARPAAATTLRRRVSRPRFRGRSTAANPNGGQAQRFGMPSGGSGRQDSLRIAPPVVRERPSYNAPRQSAPSYSAPQRQSAPSYSAPQRQSAPSYSAPQRQSCARSAEQRRRRRWRQSARQFRWRRQSRRPWPVTNVLPN